MFIIVENSVVLFARLETVIKSGVRQMQTCRLALRLAKLVTLVSQTSTSVRLVRLAISVMEMVTP